MFFTAVKTGATCDPRMETCLSPFAKCTTGICKCDPYFSPTIDGRCRLTKTRYVGESCRSSEDCEYPGTCVNGKCACVTPQRKITEEEFWIDPSLTIQCRPSDYSVCKFISYRLFISYIIRVEEQEFRRTSGKNP